MKGKRAQHFRLFEVIEQDLNIEADLNVGLVIRRKQMRVSTLR